MKEFLLLIKSEEKPKADLSPEQLQQHIQKIGAYIKRLTEEGRILRNGWKMPLPGAKNTS